MLLADTITPALTTSFLYLFILNAIIGILEGRLLRFFFGGTRRAVWWMILANYLSAWLGWFGLIYLLEPRIDRFLGPRPIERINLLAATWLLLTFAVSVIVEARFVYAATEPARRSLGKTLLASAAVNAVSYLIIAILFMSFSYSLPFNAHVVQRSDLGPLPPGMLYWVDPTGNVLSQPLDGSGEPRLVTRVPKDEFAWPYQLLIWREDDSTDLKIEARFSSRGDSGAPTDVQPTTLPGGALAAAFPSDYWGDFATLPQFVTDLRAPDRRKTDIGFDSYRHYLKTTLPDGSSATICISLPALDWEIANPTVLPDDKVIFEADNQILIFDPHTENIAFLARGTCPAIIPQGGK